MKHHFVSLLLLLVLALFAGRPAQGQAPGMGGSNGMPFSVGVSAGLLTHLGDIKRYEYYPDPEERKWGFGWFVDVHPTPWGSVSLRFMSGNLAGVEKNHTRSFNSSLTELTLNGRLRINALIFPGFPLNNWFSLYSVTGLGFVHYDARFYKQKELQKEEKGTALAIPLGAGVGFHLGSIQDRFGLDLLIEFVNRITFTDLIDGHASGTGNDAYNYFSLGLALSL